MIDSISLANKANFGPVPESLLNLTAANFIYGANGTGKTTISRIIADEAGHQGCTVNWKGPKLETLVYNRDFVDFNFKAGESLRGIFTLGTADADTMTKMEAIQSHVVELGEACSDGRYQNESLEEELRKIEEIFRSKCWDTKNRYVASFGTAFKGSMGSKPAFTAKVLEQATSNRSSLKSLESLEERAKTVYSDSAIVEEMLAELNFGQLGTAEKDPLLRKSIVGRDDLEIAGLILKLGSSDWVKQGRPFLSGSEGVCPFCQCPAPESLESALNEYFDTTFEKHSKAITALQNSFERDFDAAAHQINSLLSNASPFLSNADLTNLNKEFIASASHSLGLLDLKTKELSKVIALRPMADILARLTALIVAANQRIAEHNRMVNGKKAEERQLTSDVWRLLLDHDMAVPLAEYNQSIKRVDSEVKNVTAKLRDDSDALQDARRSLSILKSSLSQTQPTADSINLTLKCWGFSRFTIAASEQEGFYKLVREDGTEATNTLSEGERTFIAFLYFYHRMKSLHDDTGNPKGLVVAIDDPVSSLDSDVLFVVSTLIRDCLRLIDEGKGRIRQLLFFTHNVYFYKEVTFAEGEAPKVLKKKATFWIIRKSDSYSRIVYHKENPIKTPYELLWWEMKRSKQDRCFISLQNSMRRIVENYAKLAAGTKISDIWTKFEGDERTLCRSLISWLNDGSHSAGDALNVSMEDALIEPAMSVFQQIFFKLGHEDHYNHMMSEKSA